MVDQFVSFKTALLIRSHGFLKATTTYYETTENLKVNILYHCEHGSILYKNLGKGVDWNGRLITEIAAPTQAVVQRWLREVHNVDVEAYMVPIQSNDRYLPIPIGSKEYTFKRSENGIPQHVMHNDLEESYEEALEIGLQEALTQLPIK